MSFLARPFLRPIVLRPCAVCSPNLLAKTQTAFLDLSLRTHRDKYPACSGWLLGLSLFLSGPSERCWAGSGQVPEERASSGLVGLGSFPSSVRQGQLTEWPLDQFLDQDVSRQIENDLRVRASHHPTPPLCHPHSPSSFICYYYFYKLGP